LNEKKAPFKFSEAVESMVQRSIRSFWVQKTITSGTLSEQIMLSTSKRIQSTAAF